MGGGGGEEEEREGVGDIRIVGLEVKSKEIKGYGFGGEIEICEGILILNPTTYLGN